MSAVKLLSLVVIFLAFTGVSFAQDMPGVSVSTNKKSYKPGEKGTITVSFKTSKTTKIPKDPGVDISVNGVAGGDMQGYGGGGDYIDSKKVKYTFTVPNDASGQVQIAGNVKFGYCNSENGVCKMGNKDFSVKINVK